MSFQVFVGTLFIVSHGERRRLDNGPMVLKDQIFLQFRKKDIVGDMVQWFVVILLIFKMVLLLFMIFAQLSQVSFNRLV